MATTHGKRGGRSVILISALLVVVLLPVAYVASIGPVLGLHTRGYISHRAYSVYQRPAHVVLSQYTPAYEVVSWYVNLFG